MPAINLLITPQKQAIPAAGGTIDVLVRVQAPDQPEGQATPLTPKRLALVVDRSGSMDGEPLTEALRCVDYIASHLGTQDELAIVVYDDQADLLRPLAPVGIAREINSLLATVSSGGWGVPSQRHLPVPQAVGLEEGDLKRGAGCGQRRLPHGDEGAVGAPRHAGVQPRDGLPVTAVVAASQLR